MSDYAPLFVFVGLVALMAAVFGAGLDAGRKQCACEGDGHHVLHQGKCLEVAR